MLNTRIHKIFKTYVRHFRTFFLFKQIFGINMKITIFFFNLISNFFEKVLVLCFELGWAKI